VDAVAVVLTGPDVGQIAMPHLVRLLTDLYFRALGGVVLVIEEAELDAGRVLREEGEVDAFAIPRRTEWVGLARPDAHVSDE
jgi:hypothetical protein